MDFQTTVPQKDIKGVTKGWASRLFIGLFPVPSSVPSAPAGEMLAQMAELETETHPKVQRT